MQLGYLNVITTTGKIMTLRADKLATFGFQPAITIGTDFDIGGYVAVKRIHINQHVIKANKKTGADNPPITIKTGRRNIKSHTVFINGPSVLIYSPNKPLACGARLWIETEANVVARSGNTPVTIIP